MVKNEAAWGIHSGSFAPNCGTVYQPIIEAENMLNVNVIHAP